jgi:hypothetical protein
MCNKGKHAFSSPRGQSWSLGDVDFMFSWEEIIGFLSVNKGGDADDDDFRWWCEHLLTLLEVGRGGPICQRTYRYIAGAWMTEDCPGHITSP